MEDKNVLLSIKDLEVKFKVRGRILTAIRGISLDVYENESIAIVGESGSGKSVFTKTFAGMLDQNGFISNGSILFNEPDLQKTDVSKGKIEEYFVKSIHKSLNKYSSLEFGSDTYIKMLDLRAERRRMMSLSNEEKEEFDNKIADLIYERTESFNLKQTFDPSKEKDLIIAEQNKINNLTKQIAVLEEERKNLLKKYKEDLANNTEYNERYTRQMNELKSRYDLEILKDITEDMNKRNLIIAKEIYLSVGRYGLLSRVGLINKLKRTIKKAMRFGVNLTNEDTLNKIFDTVVFRVKYIGEDEEKIHGTCFADLAKVKYTKDWQLIRGRKVATIFQDPMTSLNPIITIGKQITSIIMKHQKVSEGEARVRAVELMKKVGIPNAENRYDDYPFQYSGGMRQRIVIAIALSCQPKILICDEPTTALDVTIQAQILKLIKDLQKEFNYTIVFITHDLGVVANIADRVAVLYAGQLVELGTVEEVFYDPRHPYTWALLSSLPQLAQKNTKLYSISGTPPSLYNKIVGDPFAPRNPYCLKIDTMLDSPMFKVSDTHYAKTWLLDPRAPKIEKPEAIQNIHEKLIKAFNI
ncbi:ATP-binding cassette domain-containing protein [bacterium]|nr:ATP-binding cassette domain-containing protein [bacterium]